MHGEHDPSHPAHGEDQDEDAAREQNKAERISINHHLRWEIKNLLDYINFAANFPNDREVVRRLKEILTLVPIRDEHDEALEEYIRRRSLGQRADAQILRLEEEKAEGYLEYIEECIRSGEDILPLSLWRDRMSRQK